MSVQAVESFSPYSNTSQMWTEGLPTWMSEQDAQRVHAYQIYEQIYWNVPDTFKIVMRGEANDSAIYIPTARTIVDTTNRYLCPTPGFLIDTDLGTPEQRERARQLFSSLFRRERFWSKFQSNKLHGVMRGDWVWHILARPEKPLGRRIKIEALDPAAYFPVTHPDDPDLIIAAHIVEQVESPEGDVFIRRQTYQRGADPLNNNGSDTTIYNSVGLFDVEQWEAIDDRAIEIIKPPTALPPQITAIPLYHNRNIETPGDPFGSSELRGFERIMAAINQSVSDEEMALALEGLGMYATDGGAPRDEQGRVTDWVLGPGRVVEHAKGSTFSRVAGVNSVAPMQEHLKFLINSLKEATACTDAATGSVDVTVAESGVALMLRLGPMLSKVEVRSEPITDTHNQMFYDLRAWFGAYEAEEVLPIPLAAWGSAIPTNRKAEIDEILAIFGAGLADDEWARKRLAEYGFEFDSGMGEKIVSMQQARAAATDPFGSRMEAELDEEDEA